MKKLFLFITITAQIFPAPAQEIYDSLTEYKLAQVERGATDSLAFSHDDNLLACAKMHSGISIIDMQSGECIRTFERSYKNGPTVIAFGWDDQLITSVDIQRNIEIFDGVEQTVIKSSFGTFEQLPTFKLYNNVLFQSFATWEKLNHLLERTYGTRLVEEFPDIRAASCNLRGNRIALCYNDGRHRVSILDKDVSAGEYKEVMILPELNRDITAVTLNDSGSKIAVGTNRDEIYIYDLCGLKYAEYYFMKANDHIVFKNDVSLAQRAMLTAIHHYKKSRDSMYDAVCKIRAQNIIAPATLNALAGTRD